jgi:cyclic pyranopterin phosphate synthase
MQDDCNRNIDYIRISVTDRCNLRCIYCMPEEGVEQLLHKDILTYDEIIRLCRCFVRLGIRKIKITGGEPLVRRDIADLIGWIKRLDGMEDHWKRDL